MTGTLPRDLIGFARQRGFDPIRCPSCSHQAATAGRCGSCSNCGGSGRLWLSPRGSLSDEGLVRLLHMHGEGVGAETLS